MKYIQSLLPDRNKLLQHFRPMNNKKNVKNSVFGFKKVKKLKKNDKREYIL